jgi:NAD-dependent SIR2 family protein deacetylase
VSDPDLAPLLTLLQGRRRVVALTGAGLSAASGIPDWRDAEGRWKRRPPVTFHDFTSRAGVRRRYWARSLLGWPRVAEARPNDGHAALARLEAEGVVAHVVTQNVDGLHQRAGSRRVIDLHGRLDAVRCLDCATRSPRAVLQDDLAALNPAWARRTAAPGPDGDTDVEGDTDAFRVPDCPACGGVLKPDVVFFGESVPKGVAEAADARVAEADVLLVVGSSLAAFSAFRLVRAAAARETPVALVNLGRTRADALATLGVRAPSGPVLSTLADRLVGQASER